MSDSIRQPLSVAQVLFLSVVVPICLLGGIEVLCRAADLPSRLPGALPSRLEMPAWMIEDANRDKQVVNIDADDKTLEWLRLFESGEGFRLRLVPNKKADVINTFSLLEYDKGAPFTIRANSLGFRGPEPLTPRPADVFRIAVFGDSSSFGWGVNEEVRFDYVLAEQLRARYPERRIEFLNFAIPGDSSEYGLLLAQKMLPEMRPDLTILGFGANDAKRVYVSHTAQVERFRRSGLIQEVGQALRRSYAVRTLELALKNSAAQPSSAKVAAVKRNRYSSNLSEMIRLSREHGSKQAVLVTLCTPGNYAKRARNTALRNGALFFNGQEYLNSRLPEIVAGQLHPDLVAQMRSSYPGPLEKNQMFYLSSDGCHPNTLGHRIAGEQLAALIAGARLL